MSKGSRQQVISKVIWVKITIGNNAELYGLLLIFFKIPSSHSNSHGLIVKKKFKMWLHYMSVLVTLSSVSAQIYDCPGDWVTYYQGQRCYKMIPTPEATAEEAVVRCNEEVSGSYVVSLNTPDEQNFVANMLLTMTQFRETIWLTSGMKVPPADSPTGYAWQGDNSDVEFGMTSGYWNQNEPNPSGGNRIALAFDNRGTYGWRMVESNRKLAFICEISQADAYKIITPERDFFFGIAPSDFDTVKYGPRFITQPEDVVMVAKTKSLFIECRALAYPLPNYRWYRGENFDELITTNTDVRYTLTNGRLTIQNPDDTDQNTYRCEAENEFGKIISSPAVITFGYLGEFPNVQTSTINTPAYEGASINIEVPNYKPNVVFNWQRQRNNDFRPNFIYTETTPYIFISANGRLYFAEVTKVDEAEYFCQVTLAGVRGNAEGSAQPPSSVSLPIQLNILNQAAKTDWGPIIQNDFIAVFPSPPLVGDVVRFECFAYGSANSYMSTWSYSWRKKNGFLPTNRLRFLDLNRVMIIEDAKPEDDGTYVCEVTRGSNRAVKEYTLTLEAKPYFLLPLEDKHLDRGEQMSWTCLAGGLPRPTYSWFKNGQPLIANTLSGSGITINDNILTISSADINRHTGMYQCGAINTHGTTYSGAQIRVLSFAPNFLKYPLPESIDGAIRGNITIPCVPEGAPKPIIKWRKNNADLGLTPSTSTTGRLQMLPNNYLLIRELSVADAGIYECVAENSEGSVSSYTRLYVKTGTTIFSRPLPETQVKENQTALILCQASYDPALDLIYVWKFNGRMLDIKNNPFYEKTTAYNAYGLYVKMAQFIHEGEYECIAKTPLNEATASGYLRVNGRPGEPVGVYADPTTTTQTSVQINWFEGDNQGYPVSYFIVETELDIEPNLWFSPGTSTIMANAATVSGNAVDNNMKVYVIDGLNPGNAYRFRLRAVNREGVGPPSLPTSFIKTQQAPPMYPPQNITGGNGSVGDLQIKWMKLPPKLHGGENLGYNIFYRLYKEAINSDDELWRKATINQWDMEQVVVQVGKDARGEINFYRLYEVKIQAYNDAGIGPNSSVAFIYSAMGMPAGAPQKVFAEGYNSTSLDVTWIKVPNTREAMKGVVWGYQVNYWLQADTSVNPYKISIRFWGDVDHGRVIGLEADTYYYCEVQVFNEAGLGPLSDKYPAETFNPAPLLYPEKLEVFSHDSESVRLHWRGVSTGTSEDTLKGYIIFVWQANENYRSAKEYETGKNPTEYILTGIEMNYVYAARVAGFSDGGIGKKSPTVYFTLYGNRYLASDFNFTDRYIDDVLSINNPKLADYLSRIYPSELEVKETTEANNSASYLDIMLSYDTDGHMNNSFYDKREDFNFSKLSFSGSNIPSSPAYGVFISQLIRYARASTKYTNFVLRARRLSDKLLSQGYVCDRLTSSLRKFYGRYGELVIHYDVPLSRMVDDILS
ncbi:hypothetical protein FSP39_000096 [Pinctada imbricata]|uniref:Contactin n=1 Tax=Pinctada imbricata TaxID=66713 RepID=A0AA88YPK2_PINIB|nr:hypothetical protein FSP39_000096 [Pinctada imbricata]